MSAREDLSSTFGGRRLSLPGVCRNVFLAFGQLRAGSTRTRGAMNLRVTSVFPVFFSPNTYKIYTRERHDERESVGERIKIIRRKYRLSSSYTAVVAAAARGPDRNFQVGGGNGAPRRGRMIRENQWEREKRGGG